jgi:phage-related protein
MTADMGTFSRFGKEGGKNLAEAAIMARKLGTSLESMAATSDALLDFESNINDQMEASMLLGRSINMDKARELALAGDIAGQEREILKQIGTQAQWEKMNVVQRDALAKATGKSTQDLSTMLANQANLNSMTATERANKEAMQKSDEKMNAGMEAAGKSMGDAWSAIMAPLKEVMMAVQPLFGLLMKIIGFALKPIVLQFKLIGFIIKPIIKVLGFVLGIITDISTWIENGIGKVWESIKPTIMTIGKILAVVLFPTIALMVGVVKLIMHYWEDIKGVLISVGGFIWKLLIAPIKTLWSIMQFGFGLIASMGKMIFNALITPFQMLWDGIKAGFAMWVGLIKAPFNLIIAGVNMVINAINSLSVKVPDWVPFIGGKEFGFNLPTVPSLATEAGGPGHNVKESGVAEVHKGESVGTFDMSQTNSKLDELIQLLGQSGPIATGVGGVKSNTKSISDQII